MERWIIITCYFNFCRFFFLITPHPYFIIDSTFGFYAWYGFFSCALMVIVAKVLGLLVKRSDTYYSDKDRSGDKHV